MTPPTAPLSLPPYTFIMSDHATRELTCSLAEELGKVASGVFIDDFLAPIHNALSAMFDADWKSDLGSHQNTQMRLADKTVHDLTIDLEAWFTSQFGEEKLGQLALARSKESRETYEYSFVFRDATPSDVRTFFSDESIAKRDMLIVDLTGRPTLHPSGSLFIAALNATPQEIIDRIRKVL